MSYSYSFPVTTHTDDLAERCETAYEASAKAVQDSSGTGAEALRAMHAVQSVLPGLIAAVGSNFAHAQVNVVGHCNADNVERTGWANDFVQVNVTVQSYLGSAS